MLITLDSTVADALESTGLERREAISALEYIALARKEGKHKLFGSRATLERIGACSALEAQARAVFRRVLERLPEKASFAQSMPRRVEVLGGPATLSRRAEGEHVVIQVPAAHFSDSECVQPSVLLAENLRDVAVFELMARVHAVQSGLARVPLALDARAGGGDTTADVYSDLQRRGRRLLLCLVDSDRMSPSGALGDTARRVVQADSSNRPLAECAVSDSREVENVLPTALYELLTPQQASVACGCRALRRLEDSQAAAARQFLDFKKGTTLADVYSRERGAQDRAFWDGLIPELRRLFPLDVECVDRAMCDDSDHCSCRIFPGMGRAVLDGVLTALERMSPRKVREALDDRTRGEWERLGALVLAWCCAGERMAAA